MRSYGRPRVAHSPRRARPATREPAYSGPRSAARRSFRPASAGPQWTCRRRPGARPVRGRGRADAARPGRATAMERAACVTYWGDGRSGRMASTVDGQIRTNRRSGGVGRGEAVRRGRGWSSGGRPKAAGRKGGPGRPERSRWWRSFMLVCSAALVWRWSGRSRPGRSPVRPRRGPRRPRDGAAGPSAGRDRRWSWRSRTGAAARRGTSRRGRGVIGRPLRAAGDQLPGVDPRCSTSPQARRRGWSGGVPGGRRTGRSRRHRARARGSRQCGDLNHRHPRGNSTACRSRTGVAHGSVDRRSTGRPVTPQSTTAGCRRPRGVQASRDQDRVTG